MLMNRHASELLTMTSSSLKNALRNFRKLLNNVITTLEKLKTDLMMSTCKTQELKKKTQDNLLTKINSKDKETELRRREWSCKETLRLRRPSKEIWARVLII